MNEPGKGKRIFEIFLEYRVWFFTLLLADGLCALFLWLADIRIFRLLSGLLFFFCTGEKRGVRGCILISCTARIRFTQSRRQRR